MTLTDGIRRFFAAIRDAITRANEKRAATTSTEEYREFATGITRLNDQLLGNAPGRDRAGGTVRDDLMRVRGGKRYHGESRAPPYDTGEILEPTEVISPSSPRRARQKVVIVEDEPDPEPEVVIVRRKRKAARARKKTVVVNESLYTMDDVPDGFDEGYDDLTGVPAGRAPRQGYDFLYGSR